METPHRGALPRPLRLALRSRGKPPAGYRTRVCKEQHSYQCNFTIGRPHQILHPGNHKKATRTVKSSATMFLLPLIVLPACLFHDHRFLDDVFSLFERLTLFVRMLLETEKSCERRRLGCS